MKFFQTFIVCVTTIILFSTPSIAAPPNPYLYFHEDSTSGELVPKAPQSRDEFLEALDGCCLAREQGILQSDGIEYVLALKIDFADMPGSREGAAFDAYLYASEGISLKTYYRENSYGQMDIQPGPMGGVVPTGNTWVRAKKPMTYYGEGARIVERYRELVREACEAVDSTVDFSQYDRDGDGVVDHVFLIHAGNNQAASG
ncbi:MAG: immune inhibitor A, partial [Candidatus Poribacteria bacterium]|nr:immune inhibitor A [Candidatus Poribacteria bacterium]